MKRYFSLLLCAMLCIGITGCSKESGSTKTQVSDISTATESTNETSENSKAESDEPSNKTEMSINMIEIVDKDGRHTGQIPFNSGITLTNSGIFYTTTTVTTFAMAAKYQTILYYDVSEGVLWGSVREKITK